ncbi:MAG: hypothetical protein FK734_11990 [Asgard group archaeon]|nr:hypothetical protein [Asgard group archaeon]
MSSVRVETQKIIREFDNVPSYTILASASMLPYLEDPLNRARFFDYNKELELYFDSKDINRFTRLQKLTEIISDRIKGDNVKGFERYLKLFRDYGLMSREKEGPEDGMAWQGFGGVHSHYNLTHIGKAVLIFQTSLRCSAVDFRKITAFEYWEDVFHEEVEMITSSIVNKSLKIRDKASYFYAKREETSFIAQGIFEYIAGAPKKVTSEMIRKYVFDKAGEIHLGEIPVALDLINPLLTISGDSYSLNPKGEQASLGYANLLVEVALEQDDTELVHYMVAAKNLEEGTKEIMKQYALWF